MNRLSAWGALLIATATVGTASAGWPFFSEDGLRRGTPEYYAARAGDPPGTRQKYLHGKLWPVQARPVGPEQTLVHRFHTAHYWPHPYNCQDREAIRSVMYIQARNGWQTATTFYEYHFDPETQELNAAGLKHLSWLLTYVPEEHRQAFVAIDDNPAALGIRIADVERQIAGAPNAQSIPVMPRHTHPLGRPASEVQSIMTGAAAAALPPAIQYSTGSSSGGGGGGGGSIGP